MKLTPYNLPAVSSINISFILLFLSLALLSDTQSIQGSQQFPSFAQFVSKFHKHYVSDDEYTKRQEIYSFNIEAIRKSDCTSCGVNYYTDWTSSQIQSIFNIKVGLRTLKEIRNKQKIATNIENHSTLESRILTQSLPVTFDWRTVINMTSVKNQGYCGASWAFTAVAFFESEGIISGNANSSVDLSEMYLIGCNPQSQGCSSGYVQSSIDLVIDKGGIPYEAKYPYNPASTVASNVCLQTDFFTVTNKLRMSYYRIYDPESIKQIIFKKPVIAAVCGSDFVFYYPTSSTNSSRTLRCKPQNRIIDHSVLLVGYTETQWIVKNHWGKGWGVDGYAYISRNPAEDCCIGEQLHSSGAITSNCSVQYCQTCVQTDSCYRCQPGRWVKHNTTTGVQTCELCTQANCSQCYNYFGTCKLCTDGYALNSTTGKCVNSTIANCNKLQSGLCFQCKPGYKLNSAHSLCNSFCAVKNCNKCPNVSCLECKPGFSLTTAFVNGKNSQFCLINNCSIANCTYCNSTGACVICASSFTLQLNGTCTTNCTAIVDCVSCLSGSTTCSECIQGKSYNSTKKACQVFSGTTNCKIHKTTCTTCRTGFTLSSGQCIQTCETTSCPTCLKTDISYCLTCANGYFLNRTAYYSTCAAYPCNITGCSLCDVNGSCVLCTSKYYVYNASANRCESQCSMSNCRDCLPNATACLFCNGGYAINYTTKTCVPMNLSTCLTVTFSAGKPVCYQCMANYYMVTIPQVSCYTWCTDLYCEQCQTTSLYICQKCFDGYFMKMVNGVLTCTLIPSTMIGCERISYNQSYCYSCNNYYMRNQRTGICEINTKNCPSMCDYCTNNASQYFGCRCHAGFIYDFTVNQCITLPFNDTNCLTTQYQVSAYFCMQCPSGMIVNAGWDGCDSDCIVSGCTKCQVNYNSVCIECITGFYVGPNGYACLKCPFSNCSSCTSAKCLDCEAGYELTNNALNCTKIQCSAGFLFDSYECLCPKGTYQAASTCQQCQILNCIECSTNNCLTCENSYFLSNNQCGKCQINCKTCNSSTQCLQCNDGFLLTQSQCISAADLVGFFYISQATIIQCPVSCLQCNQFGNCLKCALGTTNFLGTCINCQGYCKTCVSVNATLCTSCFNGFYLNQAKCIHCDDTNCLNCDLSTSVCNNCKQGSYLVNNTCQVCTGENCLSCNFNGQCTQCSSGYTLMTDYTCIQCGGNCRACNSTYISQCLVACNATAYELNGKCNSCPNPCKTCVSGSSCLSCIEGYQIKNNSCLPKCSQGCYECDTNDSSLCQTCLTGYLLTENKTCNPDLSCNTNQSCTICPTKWTLVNGTCQNCNLSANCTQCALGNVILCIQCQNGYFLNNSLCVSCDQNCYKCLSLDQCSQCKEGFLLPKQQIYGNCTSCDKTCKTCSQIVTKCTTCKEGYELSVNDNCLRIQKINGQIELNLALSAFPSVSKSIRTGIIQLIGQQYQNETKLYTITNLQQGSTLLSFYLAIPQDKDPDLICQSFKNQLSNLRQIDGIQLISVKKVQLIDPTKPEQTNAAIETNGTKAVNNLAIILGVVIPSAVIIFAAVGFIFRRRLLKASNAVENITPQIEKETNEQLKVNAKTKLPPLNHVNSSFTPLKECSVDQFNSPGKNQAFFSTHQQQSYEQFYENNQQNRAEAVQQFDYPQNMNARVLDQNPANQHANRTINEEKTVAYQDVQKNYGITRKQVQSLQNNELIQEIELADDNTGRQMNEQKNQQFKQLKDRA